MQALTKGEPHHFLVVDQFIVRRGHIEPSPRTQRVDAGIDGERQQASVGVDNQPLAEPLLGIIVELVVLRDVRQAQRRIGVAVTGLEKDLVCHSVETQNVALDFGKRPRQLQRAIDAGADGEAVDRLAVETFSPVGDFAHGERHHFDRPQVEGYVDLVPTHQVGPLDTGEIRDRGEQVVRIGGGRRLVQDGVAG